MQETTMNRRGALRTIGAAAAAAGFPNIARGKANKRPNIIVIMADDMGYSDTGCYGSEIDTPNLDHMGYNGIRFSQFYNCARCCPTRASLLTGLYPHQAGVGHMIQNRGLPAYQGYLNQNCVTIAEALRPAGYNTLMAGKWHVGENRPHWPLDRGFDQYYGLISGASNFFKIDEGRNFARNNERIAEVPDGFYMTDAFTDHAIRMIRETADDANPFFLYLPYTAPHWPLHAHPRDIERFKDRYHGGWDALRAERHPRIAEEGLLKPEWKLTPRDDRAPAWEDAEHKEWHAMRMAVYAAQIHCMDRNIGRVLSVLKEQGIEDDTLVMFTIDNGGCAEGRPGNDPSIMPGPEETFQSYGLPWAQASNTPFRRYKHWVHEGGISAPLIAYWPGRIQPGGVSHQVGHMTDIMPTCLGAAGAEYPDSHRGKRIQPPEGIDLTPLFDDPAKREERTVFWEHEGNRAVRQGHWKLVSRHPRGWELYDLEKDRTELNDLTDAMPEKAQEMALMYDAWAERCDVAPWDDLRNL